LKSPVAAATGFVPVEKGLPAAGEKVWASRTGAARRIARVVRTYAGVESVFFLFWGNLIPGEGGCGFRAV
jgi:hypothetical protein